MIAGTAVAVALKVKQEPLALFGMSAAMLAPLAVSEDVTTGGVVVRRGHGRSVAAASGEGGLAEPGDVGVGDRRRRDPRAARALVADAGVGGPVIAAAAMATLITCLTFLLELRPAEPRRLTVLGSLTASSAFAITLGARSSTADPRGGRSLAERHRSRGSDGCWLLAAAVPLAVRRPHADLTDLLAAYGLTSAAIATGLLAGGPALVCAWTAESAMLVLVGERIQRRSATRGGRAIVSAAAYLLLGIVATLRVIEPLRETLPQIGTGSVGGSIALVAVALAGIALCFGLRRFAKPELAAGWLVPGLAFGFLPIWALPRSRPWSPTPGWRRCSSSTGARVSSCDACRNGSAS